MTRVCIRQPGYLPYIGFFKKIQTSDVFVYLDDAQYAIRAWDNRNKIRTDKKSVWISVPVSHPFKKKLNEVLINNSISWKKKHSFLIKKNYQNAPYFNMYWRVINEILNKDWQKLVDLNLELIEYFNSVLEINTKTIKSSELSVNSQSSMRLLEICKHLNATEYLSGSLGKEYLDKNIFKEAGIKIIYENFIHPAYHQIHRNFIPNMSITDLLFNEGDNSKNILRNSINF